MLKKVKVIGLNKQVDVNLDFNRDINILTGRNGSGKTTLLKLIWYLMSANIERVIPEINFKSVYLETDEYYLEIEILDQGKVDNQTALYDPNELLFEITNKDKIKKLAGSRDPVLRVRWNFGNGEEIKEINTIQEFNVGLAEYLNRQSLELNLPTVFFPTFRRIEGGFSIDQYTKRTKILRAQARNPINTAVEEVSSALSVFQHRFVASISTNDIVELLTKQYADVSEQTNRLNRELSDFITTTISEYSAKKYDDELESLGRTKAVITQIQDRVMQNQDSTESLLRPFNVLSGLIERIFHYKGIRVTDGITLGDASGAIASDKLSSGEKQMLSFLCYNAFTSGTVIFIDEPELSLHVDWQRILFPTLLEQQTSNQFIVTTHSPFIYSKFSDKELILGNKGGE